MKDFHALLQHYEERHVKIEDTEEDLNASNGNGLDLDALIAADSLLNVGTSELKPSKPVPTATPAPLNLHVPTPVSASSLPSRRPEMASASPTKKKAKILTLGIEPCDFVGDDLSAFDNTVIRPIDATRMDHGLFAYNGQYGYTRIAPKRAHSVPAIPHLPLIKGEQNFKFIQSILSSTVDPPSGEASLVPPSQTSRQIGYVAQHPPSSAASHTPYYHSTRGNSDRPFVCPVSGCGKTYKNANGLKYHAIHGHDGVLVEKPHRCPFAGCGKRYKNSNGLKYHFQHAHPNAIPPSASAASVHTQQYHPRPSSIPPVRSVPNNTGPIGFKQPESVGVLPSNPVSIANLIKSNPMVKQHLPAILRNLQQMAIQRANADHKN